MFQSSFVSRELQRNRFSRIGNFFYVIAIKQKPDKDDVSDERLFCGDRRRMKRRFEIRGERESGIMLYRSDGWNGTGLWRSSPNYHQTRKGSHTASHFRLVVMGGMDSDRLGAILTPAGRLRRPKRCRVL